jgi:DNA invertase Pin-like site-specific DNA recombinase
MRGRKPRPIKIAPADLLVLQLIARRDDLPWYQVQRAQIVLAVADGQRTNEVARRLECDASTIWRACRRYESGGLSALLANGRTRGEPDGPRPAAAQMAYPSPLTGFAG